MSWLKDIQQTITDALEPVDVFVNNYLDVYIWYVGFVFIIAGALLFLWKFKGIQFTNIKDQVKYINPMANIDKGKRDKNSMISSFQAFCVGMGARVGVGNITGVTSAIIMGGAGAIFWMWIFALLGAATSFVECTLGQIFKEKKSDGNFHGGPAYYIKKGLKNRKFALFIAFWIIVTYCVGFIAYQAANSASAFTRMDALSGIDGITIILGLIFAAMTAFLIFGGVKKVAMASEIIVPIMVLIWLIIGFIAIIIGWEQIGWAVTQIFENAFNFKQIFAGFAGSCIMWGLKRGVFSNEAGIGSVPNVASSADVPHSVHRCVRRYDHRLFGHGIHGALLSSFRVHDQRYQYDERLGWRMDEWRQEERLGDGYSSGSDVKRIRRGLDPLGACIVHVRIRIQQSHRILLHVRGQPEIHQG